jgi:putrescine transport system ATP-binding protein
VTLAVRPEKLSIGRDRPGGTNVVPGEVEGVAYFGKDSLYRVKLPGGQVLSVNAVNARRAGEGDRVADWSDRVWLGFAPEAAILLTE